MNARLSKSLKEEFHNSLKAALPAFERIGSNFGGVIYRQTDSDRGRYLFILLWPHTKTDSFTIEFAANVSPQVLINAVTGEVK
jgi:hypothetical protein